MIEVADVFRNYGPEYRDKYKLPKRMLKAMNAIERCRTAELGGHVDECDMCGFQKISYNSCRNRHCPKCQSSATEKWLQARKQDLLPVQYFHIVFTIPDDLNPIALRNQKEIYEILFKAASATLLELSKDPKYLGAEIGIISLLHTWGQNLMDHPHLHCLVPGGGLASDGKRWINAREEYFIPIRVLSRLFRGKFLDSLKKIYFGSKLILSGSLQPLESKQEFLHLLDKLYQKEWVVYCKPPFRSSAKVLEYLGRYTHRVAISNNRIINFQDGKVTFQWRDYKNGNKNKLMKLEAVEFIRRFLLHILPDNFVKIRHYGLLSNRNRKKKLQQCREILGVVQSEDENRDKDDNSPEAIGKTEKYSESCPCCGQGRMFQKEILQPKIGKSRGESNFLRVA